jgi:hypothetical protein
MMTDSDDTPSFRDRRQRMDPPSWAPVPDPTLLTFSLVDREIQHVNELVDLQFKLIERQRVESKVDTEKALAAALAAQEKAAGVLATFTSDQLKALGLTFSTSFDQLRKDISDLKEGAKATSGRTEGGTAQRSGSQATMVLVVATLGVFFGLLGVIASIVIAVTR